MGLTRQDCDLSELSARTGRLLIERLDPGALARYVIVPDLYKSSRISASAIIRRVGPDCPAWAVEGAQVILSAAYGKKLHLGALDEVTWESIPPSFVQAVVRGKEEGPAEDSTGDSSPLLKAERHRESTFRDIPPDDRDLLRPVDMRDEEGN